MSDTQQDDALRDAVAEHLATIDLYTCGRVAEAWSYGTMSLDDFSPAAEDDTVVQELADLITDLADERAEQKVNGAYAMAALAGVVATIGVAVGVIGWTVGA